jgi:dipeptidyl aminopeptidase/acylaminoacyl peptidase
MLRKKATNMPRLFIFAFILSLTLQYAAAQQKKALTMTDIMKFKEVHHAAISEDGNWVAYTAKPDRGDGEVKIHAVRDKKVHAIPRGSMPLFSRNAQWLAAELLPPAKDQEKSDKKDKKPKKGMALLNIQTGELLQFEKVDKFKFSEDSRWLALKHFKEEDNNEDEKQSGEDGFDQKEKEKSKKKKDVGTDVILYDMENHQTIRLPFVQSFAFDSTSHYLAYTVSDTSGNQNSINLIDLHEENHPKKIIDFEVNGQYTHLTWNNRRCILAYVFHIEDASEKIDSTSLFIWNPGEEQFIGGVLEDEIPQDWYIPSKNKLQWTKDGQRLFFGIRPEVERWEDESKKDEGEKDVDLFDIDAILEKREVDVWHWNDPLINSNQKKQWKNRKDRTYRAVYHLDSGKCIPLADEEIPYVNVSENSRFSLGSSDVPYLKLITWDDWFRDYYLVDLRDGSKKRFDTKLNDKVSMSPEGKFVVYYDDKHWHLYDCFRDEKRNLTESLDVPFYNEDHDYPQVVPSYGLAGWMENDTAVLIYDKYDTWYFPTDGSEPVNLTDGVGRKERLIFRVQKLDPEQQFFKQGEKLLLTAYHDLKKFTAFYSCIADESGVFKLLQEESKFRFIAKAKNDKAIIYTRESYTEFPDIWISNIDFSHRKKLTDINPQIKKFAWGSAELVEWNSVDGIPLQGVLIKPGKYEKGKRYPVLVYFYRFFSQRLHDFNQVVINHRPCFPFYASNGYAVFLPDIRFDVGNPGFSATKCLVPGVQKLIDMGIADPDAIALHGHSWSGYQTAFVVTQTDIFTCAVAGAPVSNMTSAYSGIRWGTGIARQLQYEKSQSRIGGSLWEYPERYIENSPVFFADRINTPLLIMFGDEDEKVPWYQGIELYLAMRRLEKDSIFLQYRKEPHHLKKYANKLDYTIKMKEYLDHYCKGTPAPDWIKEGVPYRGK